MKIQLIISLICICNLSFSLCREGNKNINDEQNLQNNIDDVLKLLNETISKNPEYKEKAWNTAAYLSDTFGPRLWGSESLQYFTDEVINMMKNDGFEKYYKQEVPDTPVWKRGEEYLILKDPREVPTKIPMIGLGWSIGGDFEAEVIVVKNFEELKQLDDKITTGKIILFNCIWEKYGITVDYRSYGVIEAAKKKAIGVIIRSIAPISWENPHTGVLTYDDNVKKIPGCAISLEDADMFQRMSDRKQTIIVKFYMEAKFEEKTTTTYNIIGELTGNKYPEKILLMGGHIDSWDVGPQTGSSDDLIGFIMCYEAMRVLKKLNLIPKRTIRLIGWAGEEIGSDNNGAMVYTRTAEKNDEIKNHILAFESDLGANDITGFGFQGNIKANYIIQEIVKKFKPYNMNLFSNNAGNADVASLYARGIPILKNINTKTIDHREYFVIHHSAADTMSYINKEFVDRHVMAIAGIMYAIADLPMDLPK